MSSATSLSTPQAARFKAVILAAGYATRLYPWTRDLPKALLEIGGKTILDHLVDQISSLPQLDSILLVSNHRFAPQFKTWRRGRRSGPPVDILDDGTVSDANRRGAVGDLQFAIQSQGLAVDLLVCAADNLLEFPLAGFCAFYAECQAACLCVHRLISRQARRRTGIARLDRKKRVLDFEEKPRTPKSTWAVPPLYLFPPRILPRVQEYLQQGGNPDAPGHFIHWLVKQEAVYAYPIPGAILDIGTRQSLERARHFFPRPVSANQAC